MRETLLAARVISFFTALFISIGCSPRIQSGVLNSGQSGAVGAGVSQSTMVASPAILQADGNSSSKVKVSLRDQNGNPLAGKSVTLFSNRGSLDTIPTPSAVSDMNGDVTFQVLSAHSGTSLLSATDVTDHQVISSSASILFLPGSVIPSQTTLLASQNTVVADGVSSTQIVVTLRDAQGNPVVGKSVSLASNRGGDVISPSNGLTGNSGSISFTVSSTSSGMSLFTATDLTDNLTFPEVAQVTFISGAGNSIQSTVTASPTSVIANGTSTSTITVALKDSNGNPVPGKVVTLSSNRGGSDTLSSSSGPSNSSGLVTFTVKSTVSGSSTFTATDVSDSIPLTQTALVSFTAGPVSVAQSTLSTSASSVADDGSSTATLTVTLKDADGNPVSGKTITLSSSRGGSDTISGASGPSSSLGVVTFTVKSAHAGSSIYSVFDSTDSLSLTQTASVNYTTGSVSSSSSTLTASQTSIAADGTTTSTLTVTLKDSTGNPVQGKTVTLSSSRGASDTLSPASGSSNSSGIVTFTVKSTSGGNSTFTAVDTTDSVTINQTASVTFVASLASASQSTVSASPTSTLADGSTSSTITVTLKDSGGNPVSGKSVSLSSSRGVSDTLSAASGVSNSSGVVTFTVTSIHSGSSTFTATDSTDSILISQTTSVTFTPGPVTSAQSTVSASPTSVVADGTTPSTVSVTLLDANSNPVPGKSVTLSSSRGATDTVSSPSGPSNASGIVTFTVSSSTIGTSTYTAVDSTDSVTVLQTGSVGFVVGTPNSSNSTVSVTPSSIHSDGITTATVTVTLLDAGNHPVSGKSINLSSSRGSSDIISSASTTTDSAGKVTFTIKSSVAGTATLSAVDSTDSISITQTATLTLTDPAPSPSLSTLNQFPTSIAADNSTYSTITVTLLDSFSTPIANRSVSLTSSRLNDTLSPSSATTDSNGQATFQIKSNRIGISTVSCTNYGVSIAQTPQILFLSATPQLDFQGLYASGGLRPGNNSQPTQVWKNLTTTSTSFDASLANFLFNSSSGWNGDGTLITSGASNGAYRLNLSSSNSSFVNFGSTFSGYSQASLEAWMRADSFTAGQVLLSNADSNSTGLEMRVIQTPLGKSLQTTIGAQSYADTIVADNPYAYYRLNEKTGNTAYAYAGVLGNATYVNGIGLAAGGSAIGGENTNSTYFDGNSGYVSLPQINLNIANGYSLEIWMYVMNDTQWARLFDLGNGAASDNIVFAIDAAGSGSRQLAVAPFVGNSAYNYGTATGIFTNSSWNHVVYTSDGSGNLVIYLNGSAVQFISSSPINTLTRSSNFIGKSNWSQDPYLSAFLQDAAIYNYPLSPSQVTKHYLAGVNSITCNSSLPSTQTWFNTIASVNSTGNLLFNLNGVQTCNLASGNRYLGSSQTLKLGTQASQSTYLNGSVSDVRLYNSALSPNQMQNHYASEAQRFDLKQIGAPSPIMWLKADSIQGLSDGASVSTWPDSSANGNNASGSNQIWKANVLNGYPVVRFSNGGMNAPSVFPVNSDYSVSVALINSQNSTSNGDQIVIGFGDLGPGHLFRLLGGSFSVRHANNDYYASSGIGLNPVILTVTYQYSIGQVNFFINGAAAGSSSIESNSNSTVSIGYSYYHYPFIGDIAEIFLFGSALSTNDRSLIETYLNAKYGIY